MSIIEHALAYPPRIIWYKGPSELVTWRNEIPDKKDPHYQEKRDNLVKRAREVLGALSPEVRKLLPTRADMERFASASDIEQFSKPKQAEDTGKHNRLHLATVAAMGSILAAEMSVGKSDAQQVVAATALLGWEHDLMRPGDLVSSAVNLQQHGIDVANRLPEDIRRLQERNVQVDFMEGSLLARMQESLKFHDVPAKAPAEVQEDILFKALVLADCLAMFRYLTHRSDSRFVRNGSEYTLERKLLHFGKGDDQIQQLRAEYAPVMGAMLLLSDEYVPKRREELEEQYKKTEGTPEGEAIGQRLKNKEYQVTGVLDALSDLGLWSQPSATISVRRGAHRSE